MHPENVAAKAIAIDPDTDRDQSHADRALMDLEKSQAELAHVIGELGGRLAPVTAYTDSPGITEACTTDPSERSQLVRSIREAVGRTQRLTRHVLEITEGLDV